MDYLDSFEKCIRIIERGIKMVEIQFIDGTKEEIEAYDGTFYEYDIQWQCFRVLDYNKVYVSIPREFVKSIRYIEV